MLMVLELSNHFDGEIGGGRCVKGKGDFVSSIKFEG